MNCPRCSDQLTRQADSSGHEIDLCPNCDGVWFDAGELKALLKNEQAELRWQPEPDPAAPLQCPRGHGPMTRASFDGGALQIDRCGGCRGLFLDQGEVARLREQLHRDAHAADVRGGALGAKDPGDGSQVSLLRVAGVALVLLLSMRVMQGVVGLVGFFDDTGGADGAFQGQLVEASGGLLGLALGGAISGFLSKRYLVAEAGLAALPAVLFYGWINLGHVGSGTTALLVLAGFAVAVGGAFAGERLAGN